MNKETQRQVYFKLTDLRRTMSSRVTWYEIRQDHGYFFDEMTKRIDSILSLFTTNSEEVE